MMRLLPCEIPGDLYTVKIRFSRKVTGIAMTFRNFPRTFAASACMGLISMSLAQAMSLDEAAQAFGGQHGETESFMLDLDQSGSPEILLVQVENCLEDGCAWQLLRETHSGLEEVSSGLAWNASMERTFPAGGVLMTDGITWALNDAGLFPFGDILGLTSQRPTRTSELERIQEIAGFETVSASDIDSWSFSYSVDGDAVFAHVHVLTGDEFLIGHWGSPYLIFDHDDNLMQEGVSSEFPRIFPDPDADGFSVVDIVPAGLIIQRFE